MEDSNLSGRPSEWQKPSDRISMFPESILLHILSFLPAKDSIRTSLLSQRWRFLWTFVPVINFAGSLNIDDAENSLNMVSIISNTLIQHQFPKLQKFCLLILHKEAITSAVDIWLQFATRKNVEELELDCDTMDTKSFYDDIGEEDDENNWYILPSNVSNNSILVSLKLVKCKLRYGEGINWRSLKVLSLGKMSLSNDFIGKILSGSPLLEILELCNCWNFDFLHIKSETIRRLAIKGYVSDPAGDLGLKIAAPNIKSLEIWGYLKTRKLSLTCSSSLIHVQLTFRLLNSEGVNDLEYAKNMRELLENLRDVKDLTVGFWCLKVLALLEVETLTSLPSKLEYLRVYTNLTREEQSGIVRLLSLFGRGFVPLTLVMVMDTKSRYFPNVKLVSESDDVENYLIPLRKYLTAVLERIKTVKFVDWTVEESEIQLALFLLKNARRLENMIINRFQFRSSVKQKKFLEAAQRILSAPTCSGNSVVMFSQTRPYL